MKYLILLISLLSLIGTTAAQELAPPPGTSFDPRDEGIEFRIGGRGANECFRAADSFLKNDNYEIAHQGFLRAIELGYERPSRCYYRLAYISIIEGHELAAKSYLEKAIEVEKKAPLVDVSDGATLRVPEK